MRSIASTILNGSHEALAPRHSASPTGAAAPTGESWSRRRLLGIAAALIGVVVALRGWLEVVGPLPGDRWSLYKFTFSPGTREPVSQIVDVFDLAGRPLIAILTVTIAAWLVSLRLGHRAALLVLVAFVGVVFNDVGKSLSGLTPLWAEGHDGNVGLNYPSGHAFYATSFGGALTYLAWRRRRWDLVGLGAVLMALMGPMRVYQGVHLPSDVLAGYVAGVAWLLVSIAMIGPGPRRERVARTRES